MLRWRYRDTALNLFWWIYYDCCLVIRAMKKVAISLTGFLEIVCSYMQCYSEVVKCSWSHGTVEMTDCMRAYSSVSDSTVQRLKDAGERKVYIKA